MKASRHFALVGALLALWAVPARAVVLLDTNGFENPPYVTGDLEGQDGWQKAPDLDTSTATVQTAVTNGGTQAVELDRIGASNDRWGVPLGGTTAGSGLTVGATDQISIVWDMLVRGPASTAPDTYGPFFGVESYSDPLGGATLLGSFGVDATTGEVLYLDSVNGYVPGPVVAFNTWNTFEILLDYATQSYSVFVNSSLVASAIGFVDGATNKFSDADLASTPAAGDAVSLALDGTAFYDNLTVTSTAGAVPEMSGIVVWSLLGALGMGACWLRRSPRVAA